MNNTTTELIEISIGDEIIRSTPNHPYLTNNGWIEAEDLVELEVEFPEADDLVEDEPVAEEELITGFPELDDLVADDCVELLEEDDLVEDDPVAEDPEVEVLFTDELVTGFPEEVELLVELFELVELFL